MNILKEDILYISETTEQIWDEVRGKTIFVAGGTGFFGVWLQMSFVYINRKMEMNSRMIVLTRDKRAFFKKYPQLSDNEEVSFIEGDVCSFTFPLADIDYIIHAATDANAKLIEEYPELIYKTIINGTEHLLEMAVIKKVSAFLFISSGAVYGKQPSEIIRIKETYTGGPDTSVASNIYGEAKRMAEILCSVYTQHQHVPVKIARCFAFVGPYLPLDAHFAIGNFIRDILNGSDINIAGDGTPYRSYMYSADLMVWLWTILLKGKTNLPYNVGSDEAISIAELADMVLTLGKTGEQKINIADQNNGAPVLRYIPDINRAKNELGLKLNYCLEKSIKKTINFNISGNDIYI